MDMLVRAENLRKEYRVGGRGVITAVADVSFDLPRGGSLAIVGESGSGKTTCARMVAGLEFPTAGRLEFDNSVLSASRPHQSPVPSRVRKSRRVQMVFQDPYSSLDPRQTVDESIDEILRAHGFLDRARRTAMTVDLRDKVGLPERIGRTKPRQLSGGQRQRVAIMKALAVSPRLLILDEAVAALDVSVQAQVINLLNDLREAEGLTYLFISHDLAVVRQISDTCIVMRDGVVVESGRIDDVMDDPQTDYTRQLMDAVPRPGWKPRVRAA